MPEHAREFEWRGEGEGAELFVYAPDETRAFAALDSALPATDLPGVQSPVHAAASREGFGWAAASASHAAPDLVSGPSRGLLLVADIPADSPGTSPEETEARVLRNLGEAGLRLPAPGGAGVRRLCEEGASAAAEDGLIEEGDLDLLGPVADADADALGRGALAAGPRDWEDRFGFEAAVVVGVLDADGAGTLGLEPGMLALVVRVGAGDLGRLALAAHRERVRGRVLRGADFGAGPDLPAAPLDTEEAADALAAVGAAANFADARAARALYLLRRTLRETAGGLNLRAAWRVGGFGAGDDPEAADGLVVHRRDLARVGVGQALVAGGVVAAGTGDMLGSAPPFGAPEDDGRWPWEEAGLLERWAVLGRPERGG